MRSSTKRILPSMLGVAALAFSGLALADTTFTFSPQSDTSYGNAWTYTSGAYSVTATAWSSSGSGGSIQDAKLETSSNNLRVRNRGEGSSGNNHAMDNSGYTDFMLFEVRNSAGTALEDVTLKSLNIGWTTNDSDLTVMSYKGAVTPPSIAGETIPGLVGGGNWDAYTLNNAGSGNENVGTSALSSYWVIGASFSNADGRSDYLKLRSITVAGGGGTTTSVPLPASLLLMAAGIPLVRLFQRTKKA